MMRVRLSILLALMALLAVTPATTIAAGGLLHASSRDVRPGQTVTFRGTTSGRCRSGRVEVVSAALAGATSHLFGGKPAVYAAARPGRPFSVRVRLAPRVRRGGYAIVGRCGKVRLGTVILHVV